jgi:hypothetical protein
MGVNKKILFESRVLKPIFREMTQNLKTLFSSGAKSVKKGIY